MRKEKCKRIEKSSSASIMPLPSLPEEIIEDILLRLPTKSLIRFTSLSHQYRALISNPNFTKTHLNRLLLDQSNNHQRLFVRSYGSPSNFYSSDFESLNSISVKRNFPLLAPRGIQILGSCNGLFLIRLNQKSLYLWNPSLSKDFRRLRKPNWFSGHVQILGFGYDSSIDDYKVVRVVTDLHLFAPLGYVDQKVEVYSLKNNLWRTISNIPYGDVTDIYGVGGTLVNGSLYWRVTEKDHYDVVLGFDLANEKFRSMQLPDDEQEVACWSRRLSVVRGCLATDQIYLESPLVVVWILKEDSEKNEFIWIKLMKIPNADDVCSIPLCYRRSGEILLSINNKWNGVVEDQLVLYNEKNLSCRKYLICGSSFCYEVHMYIETLVSPKGF